MWRVSKSLAIISIAVNENIYRWINTCARAWIMFLLYYDVNFITFLMIRMLLDKQCFVSPTRTAICFTLSSFVIFHRQKHKTATNESGFFETNCIWSHNSNTMSGKLSWGRPSGTVLTTQIANALRVTSVRRRSDAKVWDRCLIDVN